MKRAKGVRTNVFVCLWGITMIIWRSGGIKGGPLGRVGGGRWPSRLTKYSGVAPSEFFCTHCCWGPLAGMRLTNLLSHHSRPISGEAPAHALPQWLQSGGAHNMPLYSTSERKERGARVEGTLTGGSGRRDATGQRHIEGAFGSVAQTPWGEVSGSLFEWVRATRTMAMGDRSVFLRLFLCQIGCPFRSGHGKPYYFRPSDDGFVSHCSPLGILTRQAHRKHDKHD